MKTCGIYKITNKLNGKFYIGSSDNLERRFSRHFLDLRKNRHDNQHLQHSWNKYGKDAFMTEIVRNCEIKDLLSEEQKELDVWVGNDICYNMRKDAICPVAVGEHRSEEVKRKISAAQKGIPRLYVRGNTWNIGRKHKPETIQKFRNRPKSCYTGIVKAQQTNIGRIYSDEHCLHISNGKRLAPKVLSEEERTHIKDGVQKAVLEGRYHKNKVPKEEYETIRDLYLSGTTNKRQLAFKYGINPSSMAKLLQRIGVE